MYVLWCPVFRYVASISFSRYGCGKDFVSDPLDAMVFEDKSSCYLMLSTLASFGVEILDFEIHQLT